MPLFVLSQTGGVFFKSLPYSAKYVKLSMNMFAPLPQIYRLKKRVKVMVWKFL